jgi:hypothetical protein
MTPEIAIPLATFLIVLLMLNRIGSPRQVTVGPDPDVAEARQLIGSKIDEYAEALALRYLEARAQGGSEDRASSQFARDIEAFIGTALLRDIEVEHPGLGRAVREVVTLEREHVYELMLSPVEAHVSERGIADRARGGARFRQSSWRRGRRQMADRRRRGIPGQSHPRSMASITDPRAPSARQMRG